MIRAFLAAFSVLAACGSAHAQSNARLPRDWRPVACETVWGVAAQAANTDCRTFADAMARRAHTLLAVNVKDKTASFYQFELDDDYEDGTTERWDRVLGQRRMSLRMSGQTCRFVLYSDSTMRARRGGPISDIELRTLMSDATLAADAMRETRRTCRDIEVLGEGLSGIVAIFAAQNFRPNQRVTAYAFEAPYEHFIARMRRGRAPAVAISVGAPGAAPAPSPLVQEIFVTEATGQTGFMGVFHSLIGVAGWE